MTTVAVVGGGVIGLSCALELAQDGHRVTIVRAEPAERATSAKAAAIWRPFETGDEAAVVNAWSDLSRERFEQLARYADSGVTLRTGRQLHRRPAAELDLSWADHVPDHVLRDATDGDPAGVTGVSVATLPVIDTTRYLPFLEARVADAGVVVIDRRVAHLDEARAWGEVVVNATGLGSRELLGDAELTPIRGQIVRLANPGLTEYTLDDEHPDGVLYVVPRTDDVVCGGTVERGAEMADPDPEVEAAILRRARELVPALADAPIVSRAVGLRPGRTAVRLEVESTPGGPVVHCYGHGGGGVTLSWGCAEEVAALVNGLPTTGSETR